MASFTSYQDTLPDPNNLISTAGASGTGSAGPGYVSVDLVSDQKVLISRTNSQRVAARSIAGHKWNINIKYNKLTLADFNPVYTFLLQRMGAIHPFYVSLPQYRTPQDSTFSTFVNPATANNVNLFPDTNPTQGAAGSTSLLLQGRRDGISGAVYAINTPSTANFTTASTYTRVASTGGGGTGATFDVTTTVGNSVTPTVKIANPGSGYTNSSNITINKDLIGASADITFAITINDERTYNWRGHGAPSVGDLFTVKDSKASNHTKAYMVTRVETYDHYDSNLSRPADYQVRITFTPGLTKSITASGTPNDNDSFVFYDPKVRVIMPSALQKYSLNVDNLYNFSLKVEEAEA